ncbi:MAG TPA: TRAP transporter fused permease subunit [Desulfatiglandales bacterium]|nr:TRAP transporter fused permease subunit [Desulfatiglandales bacterium]
MPEKRLLKIVQKSLGLAIPIVAISYILDIPLYLMGLSLFNQQYLALFWALITALIFLTIPASREFKEKKVRWYDLLLVLLTLLVGLYVAILYPRILDNLGTPSRFQLVFGFLAVVLVLESVRRTTGWPIVIIIFLFILYAKFGNLAPGILQTRGLSWSRIFQQLYVGSDFMYGIPIRVAGRMVFGFILFGHVVMQTGGGDFLFNFAQALMGRYRGGPAKVAVLASTFFGTLSGSAVANVAGTGMVTIPMMKRIGYPPTYAGAIEATASTGGQIMPPVMGAAAFVIAEFLGVSYPMVVVAALVPALLFYLGLFLQVDLRAASSGMKGLSREHIPSLRSTLREGWIFIIPLIALIITLFVLLMPPGAAALYSALVTVVATLLKKEVRTAWSWSKVSNILERTSRTLFELVAVSAAAGFVVGIVGYTGLGLSLSRVLTEAAGGSLFLLAVLTAFTSTILGMGMPTTAAYILLAVLAAPALTNLGVEPILAHLFIFYYGTLSMLTPPVCLAAYAAASIAEAPQLPLAFRAMRLAVAGYAVPLILLYEPGLALKGSAGGVVFSVLTAVIAIAFFAFGVEGYLLSRLRWYERILSICTAIAIFVPSWACRGFGLLLIVLLLVPQFKKRLGTEGGETDIITG